MFPSPSFVNTNGIQLALYEQGEGEAVVFLHGFPELAYSWRHQLPAVAAAGFRAVAPDLRGYGQSSKPDGVEHYTIRQLVADVTGLLDALDIEQAAFVAHDWGALLACQIALLAPERLHGPSLPAKPCCRPRRQEFTSMPSLLAALRAQSTGIATGRKTGKRRPTSIKQ